jgi:Ca2+:H+ antiporter
MHDRPALAIAIAAGSCTQIALFTLPLGVVLSWYYFPHLQMDMNLGVQNIIILILSVLVVFSIVIDGRVNWLEGFLLQTVYVIIAASLYLLP